MNTITPTTLRIVPEFADVPEQQLAWLCQHGQLCALQPDDYLFQRDEPSDHLYIVLSGGIEITFKQQDQVRRFGVLVPGNVTGVLPFSRMTHAQGYGQAVEKTDIFALHRDHFPTLIREHFELIRSLVHMLTTRVRDFTAQQQQNEKLMALGKLSAGLAHELNNPASAIVRSATALSEHLVAQPERFKRILQIRLNDDQVDAVTALLFEKLKAGPRTDLSLMQKASAEDELAEFLEDGGMADAYAAAESLVEYGMGLPELRQVADTVGVDLAPVAGWLAGVISTDKLVGEIKDASGRIAGLVKAVKGYTHMDRAPEAEETDLVTGIRSTLTMLQHKSRQSQVSIEENFAADLPKVSVIVGEINQVWTNLIDNALDAMATAPTKVLRLSGQRDGDCAVIKIQDSGSGIPADVKARVFEPFFTTKPMDQGTGLGLDVVRRIVLRHGGSIEVESEPGQTVFTVWLPSGSKKLA
ncbi:MAG: cyclic nucleotide-binding domain-containing protein [Bacteroidetes bacterium]|nr:cyclic nucleotide-binding domain-containing protein [Bacteroidota bacterium]